MTLEVDLRSHILSALHADSWYQSVRSEIASGRALEVEQIFVKDIIKLHDIPRKIISDRDLVFASAFWIVLQYNLGTQLNYSTTYHPETDGQIESWTSSFLWSPAHSSVQRDISQRSGNRAEYPYPFMTADAQKAASRSYDYIVVGGGTAGCPLAATLSQHYSVLVLERGNSTYGIPDVEDFRGSSTTNPNVAQAFVSEDGVQLVRARVLGGGSAINGGVYSRASTEYIRKIKWDEKLVYESYEWIERLNAFQQYKLSTWNSATKDGLLQAGVLPYNGHTLDYLVGTKISGSIFDENGQRHTAADLLQYANPENIVVLLNATASRILFSLGSGKPKASGVDFRSNNDGLIYQISLNQLSINSEVILSEEA
ncbi:protein HOTHEAD-like [Cryptomeria japonica]|uniref:protein HOTHEAD-like n=1 Tax=Cryptomeria japonica TaxID=3369 RepID=UPI0027DA73C1|nr:protein HOTHEAD-like [Cryptomeria japonica]